MPKIKVSSVSYLNSLPFIYGLQNSKNLHNEMELSLDIPSAGAQKLLNGEIDIGLVPVAILNSLPNYSIISDYCIGANGKVKSVLLFSEVPIENIETIVLDYQSKTSNNLTKILSKEYWNINPEFINGEQGFETKQIKDTVAGVVIGDRALELENNFKYKYDLSDEWFKFTKKPFVFACWVTNKEISSDFITKFNAALRFGLNHIDDILCKEQHSLFSSSYLKEYFERYISYDFNKEKKESLQLFLTKLKTLKTKEI